jgi:uncharacterized protein
MNRTVTRSLAAFGACALLASGWSAAAQPAAPPPAAQPAAAPAEPVDPERLALARRLLTTQMSQMDLPRVLHAIDAQMFDAIRKQTPNMDPARADRIAAAVEKVQAQILPQVMDGMAEAMARNLTSQELSDAVAFYEGPSGRAILQKMPTIMAQGMGSLAVLLPKMREAVIEAACADNGCTPEQRRTMMGQAPSQKP